MRELKRGILFFGGIICLIYLALIVLSHIDKTPAVVPPYFLEVKSSGKLMSMILKDTELDMKFPDGVKYDYTEKTKKGDDIEFYSYHSLLIQIRRLQKSFLPSVGSTVRLAYDYSNSYHNQYYYEFKTKNITYLYKGKLPTISNIVVKIDGNETSVNRSDDSTFYVSTKLNNFSVYFNSENSYNILGHVETEPFQSKNVPFYLFFLKRAGKLYFITVENNKDSNTEREDLRKIIAAINSK